jgi:hypothetical protein
MRTGAGNPVTELRRSLRWGAIAEWAGDWPWPVPRCATSRDSLACLPARPAVIGRRRGAAQQLTSDADMT